MRRRTLALLLLAVASTACAEAPPLSVSPVHSGALEAHTRQVVTVALLCGNTGPGRRTLRLEAELPPDWKTLGASATFTLDAGAIDTTIASFLVPPWPLPASTSFAIASVTRGRTASPRNASSLSPSCPRSPSG